MACKITSPGKTFAARAAGKCLLSAVASSLTCRPSGLLLHHTVVESIVWSIRLLLHHWHRVFHSCWRRVSHSVRSSVHSIHRTVSRIPGSLRVMGRVATLRTRIRHGDAVGLLDRLKKMQILRRAISNCRRNSFRPFRVDYLLDVHDCVWGIDKPNKGEGGHRL